MKHHSSTPVLIITPLQLTQTYSAETRWRAFSQSQKQFKRRVHMGGARSWLVLALLACAEPALARGVETQHKDEKAHDISSSNSNNDYNVSSNSRSSDVDSETAIAAAEEEQQTPQKNTRFVDISAWSQAPDTVGLLVQLVRNVLGLQRNQPTRVTRQLLGAVAGRNGCWQRVLCQAGRLLSGFRDSAVLFRLMERFSPEVLGNSLAIMRRAAVEGDDCTAYHCDA